MPSVTLAPSPVKLCHLLDQEEAACRSLLETVQQERTAIRTLAITEFHAINCKRLAILEVLQPLADERTAVVQELAQQHGLSADTSTVHALLDQLNEAQSRDLRGQYNRFLETAKMVREEIKQNVVLIEGIRGVVDQALSSGTQIIPGHDLYTQGGQASSASPLHVLIHQQG